MSAPASRSGDVTALQVDDAGLLIRGHGDFPLDVCLDGRRIFSFWLERDTTESEGGLFLAWPPVLHRFLDGRAEVSLVDPVAGEQIVRAPAVLGSGEGEIRIEDGQGNPLGLDKSLRLTRLFGSREAAHMEPLLDAMATVLDALEAAGLQPFIAYGTLLGAVRDQDFIGHDSDADLGYVSDHDHPFDAIVESFRVQRRIQEMGFPVQRYSGLAFKVTVTESDGAPRGLDVFGGLMREEMLYLMGEVGHPFRRSWLTPRSEVTLAGRTFPAPAQPDRLLEAMYGPTWRVPDPAYQFTTPLATRRRLSGWFRGTRVGFDARWARKRAGTEPLRRDRSTFATWVYDQLPAGATMVDLGCGRGRDAMFFGRHDVPTIGLDFFPVEFVPTGERAVRQGLPVRFRWFNLNELRSVMLTGAELAREPGPRIVTARHLIDATDWSGREHLLRLAKMVTRDTGRLFVQFQTQLTEYAASMGLNPVDPNDVAELIGRLGGTVEEMRELDEHEDRAIETQPSTEGPTICRMVVSWKR